MSESTPKRKPDWLKTKIPEGSRYRSVRGAVSTGHLHTVCEEAHCPNLGECWGSGTATFMILGDLCTRGCAFCAVGRGYPQGQQDEAEGERVAKAVEKMKLDYVVVTSVTRDDLADRGASTFASTVRAVKALVPSPLIELLIPDYLDTALAIVLDAPPDVLAHNIEVVERLTPILRHPRFSYRRSLQVLQSSRERKPNLLTKSSIMLGLGETDREVEAAMGDLRQADVNILVLGQYLQPTKTHAPVVDYVPVERFEALAERGRGLGFGFVSASPLARTSYKAAEAFARSACASHC